MKERVNDILCTYYVSDFKIGAILRFSSYADCSKYLKKNKSAFFMFKKWHFRGEF